MSRYEIAMRTGDGVAAALLRLGKDEAADLAYDYFHATLKARDYAACGDVLRLADVKQLSSSLMRSLLSLTFRDKDVIRARPAFFEAALAEITRRQDAARARRLVGHLR